MGALIEKLLAVIFPNRCFICDKVLRHPQTVCADCAQRLIDYSRIRGAVCDVCGLKLQECCCRPGRLYEKAVFPLLFDGDVRTSLHKLKFRGRLDKVKPFADAMYTALCARGVSDEIDLLTYIPMYAKSEKKRGYNQTKLLCEELQKRAGLPMLPLLYKCGHAETQHSTGNYLFRSGNVIGVFEPDKAYLHEIQGKHILLIDDILTTGATLNEAAKTLLIFGADCVYAAAAAATPKKTKEKRLKT